MKTENEEFLMQLLAVKNILDSYYFYKAMYDEDKNNEYASELFKYYTSARQSLENMCDEHLPVILGKANTKMYSIEAQEFVPLKFRRCLCCGKLLSSYELHYENEIDASNDHENDNISKYNLYNKMYFEHLDTLIRFVKTSKTRKEAILKFEKLVENQINVEDIDKSLKLRKSIKK